MLSVSRSTGPDRDQVRVRTTLQHRVDTLLVRTGEGDREAFADLYDLTSARVFGLCRRIVRDATEAEDIAQDAYLEMWTKAGAFDPGRGAGTGWMLSIAHHRAVDRVRASEGARRRDTAWSRDAVCAPGDETPERVLAEAEVAEIRAALDRISEVRRQAVIYAFFSDHTYVQASSLLGIPLGTFKSRVRDGVRALRTVLAAPD